jgi:hypothetical protein
MSFGYNDSTTIVNRKKITPYPLTKKKEQELLKKNS